MGYDIFNAIAHIAMIILVGEIFVLLTVPLLAVGAGGIWGLRFARRKLGGHIATARTLPPRGVALVDRACSLAAWPVIQATSIWRGAKAALRRVVRAE